MACPVCLFVSCSTISADEGFLDDLLSNFNPISTVVCIPIYNWFLYPTLRRMGIRFNLIQRSKCDDSTVCLVLLTSLVCVGYLIGAVLNAVAAIIQWQIYKTSPCGYHATECTIGTGVSPLVSLFNVFALSSTDKYVVCLAHHYSLLATTSRRCLHQC